MGRRDPDPRPEVEVLGPDRGVASSQTVAVGGPRAGGPDRRRVGLVVLAVVGLLGVGLALGGEGDGEQAAPDPPSGADTTTTSEADGTTAPRPRPSSTTTTAFVPTGPVLGEPVDGSLLLFADRSWTLVELATGARRSVRLPTDSPYGAIPVEGGIVLLGISAQGPGATFYDLSEAEPEGRFLHEGDQIHPSGRSDAVWVSSSPGPDVSEPVTVRLVDLAGTVLRSIVVEGTHVAGASDRGVVTSRGGRVFLVDESGAQALVTGDLLAVGPDRILVTTCADDGACRVEHLDLATGATRVLGPALPWRYGYSASAAADGRLALVGYGEQSPVLDVLAADGSSLGRIELPALGSEPLWLPGDLGLLVVDMRRPRRIPLPASPLEVVDIEALDDLSVELAYVIQG